MLTMPLQGTLEREPAIFVGENPGLCWDCHKPES